MKKESYDKKDWAITINNTGAKEPTVSSVLHSLQKVLLPKVFEEFKEGLGANPDVVSLVSNWNTLKIPAKYMDYVGCFLAWNKAHHADPNSRRFIREPNEHPKTTHIYTTSAVTKKRSQKQASLTSQPPKKAIALDKSSSSTTTTKQTKIIGKYSKTHHFNRIETFMTNLPITGECTTSMEQFGKGFCLSIVHSGVNKMLSNDAIIENYQTAIAG